MANPQKKDLLSLSRNPQSERLGRSGGWGRNLRTLAVNKMKDTKMLLSSLLLDDALCFTYNCNVEVKFSDWEMLETGYIKNDSE